MAYERPLGEAKNTYDGKLTAIRLFNYYAGKCSTPSYELLTEEDVESDNLQHILGRFAIWFSSFDMPRFHDENFEPRSSSVTIEYVVPNSKKKYFERLKAVLLSKFPTHDDWKVQSEWWVAMVNSFETESERHQKLSKLDIKVTDRSVCSLYKENSNWKI